MKKMKIKNYLFESLLLSLEDEGYEIYNIEERKYELEFKIRGLKNWTWWVWTQEDEEYPLIMFSIHDLFIDKVKPSYSDISIPIPKDFDLEGVAADIDYIMAHQALVFTGYSEDKEIKAIIKMWRDVTRVKFEEWKRKVIYKKLHRWAAVGSFLNLVKVIYVPDKFNKDEYKHLNDYWYVYPNNLLAAAMQRLLNKSWMLGSLIIVDDEEEFRWEALCSAGGCCRLNKSVKLEDGSFEVDDDEVWATLWQMDDEGIIKIYGEV